MESLSIQPATVFHISESPPDTTTTWRTPSMKLCLLHSPQFYFSIFIIVSRVLVNLISFMDFFQTSKLFSSLPSLNAFPSDRECFYSQETDTEPPQSEPSRKIRQIYVITPRYRCYKEGDLGQSGNRITHSAYGEASLNPIQMTNLTPLYGELTTSKNLLSRHGVV